MIDVQDPQLNFWLNFLLGGILVFAVLSVIPFRQIGRFRWASHVWPLLTISFYVAYEFLMPSRFDIRLDLFFIWPVMAFTLAMWGTWFAVSRREHLKEHPEGA